MSSQVVPITVRVGTNLKRAREAAGLSQRELGDRVGVDGSDISRYERGVVRMGDDRLVLVADVLGHDVSWFYVDHPPAAA